MEVRWSGHAYDDLKSIFDRINEQNPGAALEIRQIIKERCASLSSMPNRGRVSRVHGRRELVFPSLPYIAVYRVTADAVEISRIYHAAQNWP
jgi:addiction module RelE/StbE family toxin